MALPLDPDLAPIMPPASRAPAPAAATRPAVVVLPAEPERWTRSHTLAFPLIVDGERLEAITATALTGEQLLDCVLRTEDNGLLGRLVRAEMCKLPAEVFSGLHADDHLAIEEMLRPLLPAVIRADEDGGLADIRADAAKMTAEE